jgi:hypothetical protein
MDKRYRLKAVIGCQFVDKFIGKEEEAGGNLGFFDLR